MTSLNRRALSLGALIKEARLARQLTIRELSTQSEIARSTLLDLEQDKVASPKPQQLQSLAEVLDIELADLYAAAGYVRSEELPSFTPYLRSKYADLPQSAQAELERSFAHIAEKYGYDAAGPAPREDEN